MIINGLMRMRACARRLLLYYLSHFSSDSDIIAGGLIVDRPLASVSERADVFIRDKKKWEDPR